MKTPDFVYRFRNDGTTKTRFDLVGRYGLGTCEGMTFLQFETISRRSKTGLPSVSLKGVPFSRSRTVRWPSWSLEAPAPVGYLTGIFVADVNQRPLMGWGCIPDSTGRDHDAVLVELDGEWLTLYVFLGKAVYAHPLFSCWIDGKLQRMEFNKALATANSAAASFQEPGVP